MRKYKLYRYLTEDTFVMKRGQRREDILKRRVFHTNNLDDHYTLVVTQLNYSI